MNAYKTYQNLTFILTLFAVYINRAKIEVPPTIAIVVYLSSLKFSIIIRVPLHTAFHYHLSISLIYIDCKAIIYRKYHVSVFDIMFIRGDQKQGRNGEPDNLYIKRRLCGFLFIIFHRQ